MKKRIIALALMLSLLIGCMTACAGNSQSIEEKPDITTIRSICEMATLECYYHNVAKSDKTASRGITHVGEKDRKFWVEYDGVVKLGIDMSKVKMTVENRDITITIPKAKVLSVTINEDSYNKDSFIAAKDGINSNKITAEDATKAVKEANEEMKETAQENTALLANAQHRAKDLIENYVQQIGKATGVEYKINWQYIDNEGNADTANKDISGTESSTTATGQ